jgi:hypothetical protein
MSDREKLVVVQQERDAAIDAAKDYAAKIQFLLKTHKLFGPEGYTFPDGDTWTDHGALVDR